MLFNTKSLTCLYMYAITSMIKLGLNNRNDFCPEKYILNVMNPKTANF